MADFPFETLIKANKAEQRWYPQPVDRYGYSIKLDINVDSVIPLRKNIAYSLQYLEFLEKELAELRLSSVIYIMICKTYVITGMSILEGLFTNIIKSHGWWKTSNLESLGTTQASETKFGDDKYVVKTELLKKVDAYNLQMNLEEMIQKLNHHHDALGVDHNIYPALKRFKNFRNRIHLQMLDGNSDHDYNAFDFSVKKEMGAILYEILTSNVVTDRPETFDFLKVNCD